MKRVDLRVGAELYFAEPWRWDGNHHGDKVTVLAVEPYEWNSTFRTHRPTTNGRGNGVYIEKPLPGGGSVQKVVPLSQLRGPYDQIAAEVEQRIQEAEERAIRAEEERRQLLARVAAVTARAKALGITVTSDGARFLVTAYDMEWLLTAAEQAKSNGGSRDQADR